MNNREKAVALVSQMTIEEKAGLCSGADCWNTKSIERLSIPSIMVSDGPHGLRKQIDAQDNLGIGASIPATCFPTASLVACSFDTSLAYDIGRAIGEECLKEKVSVVLGPGINMKRSPLCGRNFEYYSEDPIVSGKMAAGMINGIQSTGTFACLKHFAVNNQERRRMNVSAVIDERTLHEIYLKTFEIAIREANPRTVMCSYNRINEVYASENKYLLTDVLRNKWGYQGMVISDWGAVHDRVLGIDAGLDLEMPGSCGVNDKKIATAVSDGRLSEESLNQAAANVVELVLDSVAAKREDASYDREEHHKLAIRAARESMVLVKNRDGLLPLRQESIAVIGALAEKNRIQGAGSSKITPFRVDTPLEMLEKAGVSFSYAKGYEGAEKNETLIREACEISKDKDKVVIFAGLPERFESEGFDRKDMQMPENQNHLIEEISKVNSNVIVVLIGGAPIEIPWEPKVKAVLLSYLGGEGVGTAIADILTGKVSPSGKLAETWPLTASDAPCAADFPGDRLHVLYREKFWVGYRYYDSFGKPVRFSFGEGLSYAAFQYKQADVTQIKCKFGDSIRIPFIVKNEGHMEAKETSFVFVSHKNEMVDTPRHQLVGFLKQEYLPGEEKTVNIEINTRDFGYYHVGIKEFYAESGTYELWIGGSLTSLPLRVTVELESTRQKQPENQGENFEALVGYALPCEAPKPQRPFTKENCLEDVQDKLVGKILIMIAKKLIGNPLQKEENQDQMMDACIYEMPFFALQTSSNGLVSEKMLEGIIDLLNGHYFRGIRKIL